MYRKIKPFITESVVVSGAVGSDIIAGQRCLRHRRTGEQSVLRAVSPPDAACTGRAFYVDHTRRNAANGNEVKKRPDTVLANAIDARIDELAKDFLAPRIKSSTHSG